MHKHLEECINGAHKTIKQWLKTHGRDHVRQFTANGADTWEIDLDDLDPNFIDRKLLDIGVIVPTTRTSANGGCPDEQAKRYASLLVNFCPEGYSDPFNLIYPAKIVVPKNVVLVNVRHSPDCTILRTRLTG